MKTPKVTAPEYCKEKVSEDRKAVHLLVLLKEQDLQLSVSIEN